MTAWTTPRHPALERHLTDLAAQAANLPDDRGLRAYADYRTLPGPLRDDADWDQEAAEEVADLANYLVWGCIEVYDGYMAGDAAATAKFERRMRALVCCVQAWHELHTDAH